MSDVSPGYPALDVTPSITPTPATGAAHKPRLGLVKTPRGRIMLALGVGTAIAASLYVRSRWQTTSTGVAAAPVPTSVAGALAAPAAAAADMAAGLSGDTGAVASDIPAGGFDFQNIDPGGTDPSAGNIAHIIVDIIPPVGTSPTNNSTTAVTPTTTPTPTAPTPAKPTTVAPVSHMQEGLYRSSFRGAYSWRDGQGHSKAWSPNASQLKVIKQQDAIAAKTGHSALTTGGIQHYITKSGEILPMSRAKMLHYV